MELIMSYDPLVPFLAVGHAIIMFSVSAGRTIFDPADRTISVFEKFTHLGPVLFWWES